MVEQDKSSVLSVQLIIEKRIIAHEAKTDIGWQTEEDVYVPGLWINKSATHI